MGRRGVSVDLKYVQRLVDRHGRERFYFRRPGAPRATLPGSPGTPEFMAAYHAALAAQPLAKPEKVAAPGTFERLIREYLASPKFLKNRPSSQKVTRGILLRFAERHGHRLVAEMRPKNMLRIMADMAETPAAANNLLKKLRALFKYARLMEYCQHDPTIGVDKYQEGTHHTWTDDELAQFETRWPLGTRERTGYALALYSGQRRADLVAALWSDLDLKAGTIKVVQEKTGARLTIPLHRELRRAIEARPRRHATVLATPDGRGTSAPAFGNMMAYAIEAAGLPERCVLHGLRKAAARRLAEAGCSPHEIMAITGHRTLSEVTRYTDAVEQEDLAEKAIVKLEEARGRRTKKQ